jgi:hypothetical protein
MLIKAKNWFERRYPKLAKAQRAKRERGNGI